MKFTTAALFLATSALAAQLNARGHGDYEEDYGDDYGNDDYGNDDYGNDDYGGDDYGEDAAKTLTTYTTVTTCPVTSTYTKEGSTYCVTELTTSTIVVTDCKGCVKTVHGPDVTKTDHEVDYTTKTTVCPVTETKTIEGEVVTVTYTTTKETVVAVESTVYDVVHEPDVTKIEKEVEYTTKTTVCPVTETKTVEGEVVTVTYTTTKETVVAVQSTIYDTVREPDVTKVDKDVVYTTKTTVCPVTETKTIEGEVVTVTYTTTKETVVAVKTTLYDTVKHPDVTKTKVDVAYHTKTSLCPVTETKTVNGEVITKVYTTTSYIVEKVETTIPAFKTIHKTVGEAKVETVYSKILVTVGGGTVIETIVPKPTTIEIPATEVVTVPDVTKTYVPPPVVTTPAPVQPGAGHANKAPAVALMAGLVGALALL